MMVVFIPRFVRVVIHRIPHHITHRGNRRDDFYDSNNIATFSDHFNYGAGQD